MDQRSTSFQSPDNEMQSSFGLTAADVREFREICASAGFSLTETEAADRARAVLVFYRMLVGPLPEDPGQHPAPTGSNIGSLASWPPRKL